MSEDSKTFQQRADEFIALANDQAGESSTGDVNTALLYAAARFNAFSVARVVEDADKLQAEKEEALRYFTERYRNLLEQNLDEYISRFENYAAKPAAH
jgi:hypothetical protein